MSGESTADPRDHPYDERRWTKCLERMI